MGLSETDSDSRMAHRLEIDPLLMLTTGGFVETELYLPVPIQQESASGS